MAALSIAAHPGFKFVMFPGGIRSGKSFVCSLTVLNRALRAGGSRHAITHAFGNICHRNLFDLTFPEVVQTVYPGYWGQLEKSGSIHRSDHVITLPNKSEIHFFGLDDPNKIRGNQFSTIWINECNRDVDYEMVSVCVGRLNEAVPTLDGSILETKLLLDLNPTFKSSWEYQLFVEGKIPGTDTLVPNRKRYKWFRLNPRDNAPNLAADYFEVFDTYTEEQRINDEEGEWRDDNPDALFSLNDIQRGSAPADFDDVVVSVDHATTVSDKSDETGIIVAGRRDGHYYVLEDASMKAKPEVWAQKAVDLYHHYGASWLLTETNQGGDLIERNITTASNAVGVRVKGRPAIRNKVARAGPVQPLYAKKLVTHVRKFRELEQQMIEFDAPKYKGHDDRIDALVYALSELNEKPEPRIGRSYKASGFWG